jgi:uncharacterized protein (UPF0276 family)
MNTFENLGIGLGLRIPHYNYIFEHHPQVDFFEIISENFMGEGGKPLENLDRILEHYRLVQHGVSLSIGSTDPLNFGYLKKLKALTKKTKTPWFSDHLCWSQINHKHLHDLLPLPYTEATIKHVAERAKVVQDYIELPFALENLSAVASYNVDQMPEWEFYSEICERANCSMLFDVNNVYVSSRNHDFDPMDYMKHINYDRVAQVHVAGHTDKGTHVLDTHNDYVRDEVWDLYRYVHQKTGGVTTLLEWDDDFISFEETLSEAMKAKKIQEEVNAITT